MVRQSTCILNNIFNTILICALFTGYVNVCAAVCLVLLVGGLSPQSNAAPHKRTMERQRREAQKYDIWDNPCDYDSNVRVYINI